MALKFADIVSDPKPKLERAAPSVPRGALPKPVVVASVSGRRRGRPRFEDKDRTIEAAAPWEAMGISRRTWYARQKEKRNIISSDH